jgi:hypothetical protein
MAMKFLLVQSIGLFVMLAACNNSVPSSRGTNDSNYNVHIVDSMAGGSEGVVISEEKEGRLSVSISASDTFDSGTDTAYGVGDDDMFTANDIEVFKLSNGHCVDVANNLNDYNLTTALKGCLRNSQPDTFGLIINFPGLYGGKKGDTSGI